MVARDEGDPELFLLGDLGEFWLSAMGSNRNLPRASDGSVILSSRVLIVSLVLPHRHTLLRDPCRFTPVFKNLIRPVSFIYLLSFTMGGRASLSRPLERYIASGR